MATRSKVNMIPVHTATRHSSRSVSEMAALAHSIQHEGCTMFFIFFYFLPLSESHDILEWMINNSLNHKRPQILTV